MDFIKNFIKNSIIYLHSFIIEKNGNQFFIPILLNKYHYTIPIFKKNRPLRSQIFNANEMEKKILSNNLNLKYGFKDTIIIKMENFKNNQIINEEIII